MQAFENHVEKDLSICGLAEGWEAVHFDRVAAEFFDAKAEALDCRDVLPDEIKFFRAELQHDGNEQALGRCIGVPVMMAQRHFEQDAFVGRALIHQNEAFSAFENRICGA